MVEKQPQAPHAAEKAFAVIDVKGWVALGTLLLVVAATLIWAYFGAMQLRLDAAGVLVRSGRTINLYAPENSFILDLAIDRDHAVERDQVVARLDQSALVNEINAMLDAGGHEMEIAAMRKNLLETSQILATDAGRVQDIYVGQGDYVSRGTKIATIQQTPREGSSLECLLFIPAAEMKGVEKGMRANVYPASANKDEYGNLYGTVAFISDFPVTYSYLCEVLGSEELAREYAATTAYYEVTINLITSEDTPTGYKWTTSEGPDRPFGDLTMCDAAIILDELRPLDVFFNIEL